MELPADYIAALEQLARAFDSYRQRTGFDAVLVGGAAVAIAVSGMFMSSDFDVVAPSSTDFEAAMLEHGFQKEDRQGYLQIGYYHPDHPQYGFQQVSGSLFDGRSDARKLVRIVVSTAELALPSVEDLIADRLAQHAVSSPTDDSRLRQARTLFRLAESLDFDYLLKRITEEGGDPALLGTDVWQR